MSPRVWNSLLQINVNFRNFQIIEVPNVIFK